MTLEEKIDVFCNETFCNHDIKDKRFFHYTDFNGLTGIITNQELWMSNFQCMNDSSEFKYGICLAIEIFKNHPFQHINPEFFEKTLNFLREEARSPSLKPFVLSVCEKEDYFHMWQRYTNGHKGYSLSLDLSVFNLPESHIRLFKVEYELGQQKKILNKIFTDFDTLIGNHIHSIGGVKNMGQTSPQDIIRGLIQCIHLSSTRFKSEEWKDEQEWRIIKLIPKDCFIDLFYRNGNNSPIEYTKFKIDLAKPHINSIRFGKNLNEHATRNCLESFINKQHLKIPVLKSNL